MLIFKRCTTSCDANVEGKSLRECTLPYALRAAGRAGCMSVTAARLGAKPVLFRHTAELKVDQVLARAARLIAVCPERAGQLGSKLES